MYNVCGCIFTEVCITAYVYELLQSAVWASINRKINNVCVCKTTLDVLGKYICETDKSIVSQKCLWALDVGLNCFGHLLAWEEHVESLTGCRNRADTLQGFRRKSCVPVSAARCIKTCTFPFFTTSEETQNVLSVLLQVAVTENVGRDHFSGFMTELYCWNVADFCLKIQLILPAVLERSHTWYHFRSKRKEWESGMRILRVYSHPEQS